MNKIFSVLDVNDDCLGMILSYLDLVSCDQARQTCRRFENLVKRHCRPVYSKWSRKYNTRYLWLPKPDFAWALSNMSDTLKYLDLDPVTIADMQLLQESYLPSVDTLVINMRSVLKAKQDISFKEYTRIVVKTFPNLRTLVINGAENVKYLAELPKLQELELYFYHYDEIERLQILFEKLNLRKLFLVYPKMHMFPRESLETITDCTTLEDIALNGDLMNIALNKLKEFPKLRRISFVEESNSSFYGVPSIYIMLQREFCSRVTTLNSRNLFSHVQLEYFQNGLPNLQRLFVSDRFVFCYNENDIMWRMSNLREMHFVEENTMFIVKDENDSMYACDDEDGLLDKPNFNPDRLLDTCENLELLCMPYHWLEGGFEVHLLQAAVNSHANRTKPLEVRSLAYKEDFSKAQKVIPNEGEIFSNLRFTLAEYPDKKIHWTNQFSYSFEFILDETPEVMQPVTLIDTLFC